MRECWFKVREGIRSYRIQGTWNLLPEVVRSLYIVTTCKRHPDRHMHTIALNTGHAGK